MKEKIYSKFENEYRINVINVEHQNKIIIISRIIIPIYILITGTIFLLEISSIIISSIIILITLLFLEQIYYKSKVKSIKSKKTKKTLLEVCEYK